MGKKETADSSAHTAMDELFRDLVETSRELMWQCDARGRFTYLNPAWETTLGRESAAMLGKTAADFQTPEAAARDREAFARLLHGGDVEGYETVLVAKSGESIHVVFNGRAVRDRDGAVIGARGIAFDVSERVRTETRLKEREEQHRAFIETMGTGYVVLDATGTVLDANLEYVRLTGHAACEEILGRNVLQWTAAEDREKNAKALQECMAQGGVRNFEVTYEWQSGRKVPVEVNATVTRITGQETILGLCRDITARKENQRNLKLSEERFRKIIESSPMGIHRYELQPDGRLVFVGANPASERILGISTLQFLGMCVEEAFPDLAKTGLPERYKDIARNGGTWHRVHTAPNGRAFEAVAFQTEPGKMAAFFSEVTERAHTEAALQDLTTQLQSLNENLADGMVYQINSGQDGSRRRFTYLSPALERMHGLRVREIMDDPRLIYEQIVEADRPVLAESERRAFAAMSKMDMVARVRLPSGEIRWRHFVSDPRRLPNGDVVWDGIELDITEHKRAEEEHARLMHRVEQVQRLESLGVLAGGIAHDFNNLMGGVFGFIDLALAECRDAQVASYLARALRSIDRARGLTRQLLTFAKGGTPVTRVQSLFPFVRETAHFALSGSNVSCECRAPGDLRPCTIDVNQIGQVVDNLVINAQQAMPAGGTIEILAANVAFGAGEHPLLGEGLYVRLSFKDSGIGIPKEIIARIFDPFFTTKERGHGLGLATCHSIVTRHGGCIDVESEPGQGSTFHVYLPAAKEPATREAPEAVLRHTGNGTVLVMDDDEAMRGAMRAMLESLGYAVVCCAHGEEAVDFLAAAGNGHGRLAAMILDLTVPGGLGGRDVIADIRKLDACLPVIVASGYADDPVMANPAAFGFTASICKPLTMRELVAVLAAHVKA